jgi:hypothetical protein
MLVYAGIDEAGYGPLLGPLCVAACAFSIDGFDATAALPDLWKTLSAAIAASPSDRRGRIAIADSKRLKGAGGESAHPLRHLERGVLAALGSAGDLPATDAELLARLGVDPHADERKPWYDSEVPLPVGNDRASIEIAANRFRVAADRAGVRLVSLACEILDGKGYNERIERFRNKAEVNFALAMRHLDRIRLGLGDRHPTVVIDRQGGRTHYREALALNFPDAAMAVLDETEAESAYRLRWPAGRSAPDRSLTVRFVAGSEDRHLPVALASMTAKLVRELLMARLNRHFGAQNPDLKPTAGYVEDGRRYLDEIRPLLEGAGIAVDRLVRSR